MKDTVKYACFMINGHRVEFFGDDDKVTDVFVDRKTKWIEK